MDRDLYDEFGNYIGPEVDDESEDEEDQSEEITSVAGDSTTGYHVTASESGLTSASLDDIVLASKNSRPTAVVPYEEKQFYPEAEDVYPGVEVLVEDEDTQPLTEPIIAPVRTKNFDIVEKEVPVTTFSYEFLASLMSHADSIRIVCFLGNLHAGKTSIIDMFVQQTHNNATQTKWDLRKQPKYTDSRKDEIERGLSVKAKPISLVVSDGTGKSRLLQMFDTPGHPNFQDECTAAIRLCDGAVIVIDAVMGVTAHTERLIQHAYQERMAVTIVINCIDRLILELRLPPSDAFFKLRHIVETVNSVACTYAASIGVPFKRLSPALGNVAFAAGALGLVFTVQSFAKRYADLFWSSASTRSGRKKGTAGVGGWMRGLEGDIDIDNFARCLWGDTYFNRKTGSFSTSVTAESSKQRTFVEFILEPIYKLFSHTIGEEQLTLEPVLQELGIVLNQEDYDLDSRSLLKLVCQQFCGSTSPLVDMFVKQIPNPKENAKIKVQNFYNGATSTTNETTDDSVVEELLQCHSKSEVLMVHTTKNYHRPDCSSFDVLGRVFSGTLCKGQTVKVLGETYSSNDTEDMEVREITHLWIYQAGRYRVEVSHVPAGNLILIGGVSPCITKTATITNSEKGVEIFKPLRFSTQSVIRVSCEPLNPSELPKMLEGFRKVCRSYPLCQTKVEESGELVVYGTGEIYLDCLLHDLRRLYGDLEIKVADPVVQFCETVVETTALKCFAETPNKKNKIFMITEPLERGLGDDIEQGRIKWPSTRRNSPDWKKLGNELNKKYNWDALATKSLMAFGPDERGSNVLLNETFLEGDAANRFGAVEDLIIQGFQWVTREGPLIEEQIRNCKFRLLDAEISSDPTQRGGGQIIPTARRVAYSSFLLATPRLMEPIYFVEVECPADCVSAVYTVLARRRGYVAKDFPKAGTPVYVVHAYLPAIESFGFETDLRTHTSGQAFCLSIFDHWALVPGDPLDKSIMLRPLEPAPAPHLAREFLLKTRRRKGLSENVAVHKFFDNPMLIELSKNSLLDD